MPKMLLALGLLVGSGVGHTTDAWQQGPPPPPPMESLVSAAPVRYGTGAISGVVIDGATGLPVAGALVQLVTGGPGGPGSRPRQRTDARGRFIFHRLPAYDTFGLQASREGYFDAGFKSAPGAVTSARIALRDGEWFAKANFTLWKPAAITGTVRDERGEPLVGVAVRPILQLVVAGRVRLATGPAVVTDDRGMYRLANLRPGRYVVHVPSVQITLPDGTAPLPGSRSPSTTGAPSQPEPLQLLRSDDAGRSDGLSLLVGYSPTAPPGTSATAYPMMYHPSARSLDQAEAVSVDHGELKTNVDVTLALVSTVRITGQVVGSADTIAKLPVRLMPLGSEELGDGAEAALTLTDSLGRFTFLQVPSGTYTVIASTTQSEYVTGSAADRSLWPTLPGFVATSMASGTVAGADGLRYSTRRTGRSGATGQVPVSVGDQNIDDLAVPIQAGVTVSGMFLWDGGQAPPEGTRFPPFIRLEPADGNLATGIPIGGVAPLRGGALPTPTTFELPGVLPGRYVFGESLIGGAFTIEAIEYGGQDLLTTPLVVSGETDIRDVAIRLTTRRTSVTGRVTSANGTVPEDTAVIVFPADRAMWRDHGITGARFKTATVAPDGGFRAPEGMPPGEYYAAAIHQNDRSRWIDVEFLTAVVARATRIRLLPGSPVVLDLRVDGGGR